MGINQFMGGWRRLRKDTQPGKWIGSFELTNYAGWDRRPTHTMESIAAGNIVAANFLAAAVVLEADARGVRIHVVQRNVADLEQYSAAGIDTSLNEIFNDFMLSIYRHSLAAGQCAQVDAMTPSIE